VTDFCDFSVAARIIASDGTTVRGNLNDHTLGLSVRRGIGWPEENQRREHAAWARVVGSVPYGPPVDDADELTLSVLVEGSTWPEVNSRWQTVRGWLRAEWDFSIEIEEEGVAWRWLTERPNVLLTSSDLKNNRLVYTLRFVVQPNPSVTITA
jgi:hypothetical protein